MGDGVQILKWTLTTVHSYWLKQTLQGEKVAFKVRKGFQSDCAKTYKWMMQLHSTRLIINIDKLYYDMKHTGAWNKWENIR